MKFLRKNKQKHLKDRRVSLVANLHQGAFYYLIFAGRIFGKSEFEG
jgi:hypothetical protein